MAENVRLLLLAGHTEEELKAQLALPDQLLLDRDDFDQAPCGGPSRLAILNADARKLARARQIVEGHAPWKGRHDIWFTATPLLAEKRGSIAFIFPGVEQNFEPAVDDVSTHFQLPCPELAGCGHSVLQRSISVLSVGRLLDMALRRIGIEPAAVAGHSIGEWNAMMSAGIFSTASMDQLIASVDPAAFELPGCLFAALGCGAELAEQAIDGLHDVVISHDNCPHQTIICGEQHAIAIARERLAQRGVISQVLNFRSGFHSPLLAPYLEHVSAVANLPIGIAQVPVWSATTTAPFPANAQAIRELVIRHLLEPVRFRTLIERLYASGIRAFVQAGVGSLTGFIDDTLAGRDYIAVAANVAGQPGMLQLRRIAAALWVEGAELQLHRLAVPASRPGISKRSNAVVTEFEAVLVDATEAARAIVARFSEIQNNSNRLESREANYTWSLSLEQLPFVIDHCLVRQPADWPVIADRQPVIPLTTTFELMRDVARRLVPERMPIALRKVSAMRWLSLDSPLHLEVTAKFDGRESVEVDLGGYARATVIVAEKYPDPPAADINTFLNEHASPVKAEQLYSDHWLFHGPAFQGVTELGMIGDDGLRGKVRVLPSTGALIDCAGQMMVFWIMAALQTDRYTLPAGVEAVEFFGPPPDVGSEITSTVRIRSVTSRTVYADLELADANGRVWARLTGFKNHRFATDEVIWPVLRYPENNTIAESQPGGWVQVAERWSDAASRELIARRYLASSEREEYNTRPPRGRRHWLMGRIAAKDAVRRWLWARGAGPLFPVQVTVQNDSKGRPFVSAPAHSPVCVSIAHSGDLAVAIAHEQGVGIDVELVECREPSLETIALSKQERQLLDRLSVCEAEPENARAEVFTRFWTAKEAVSKLLGIGMAGHPAAFEVCVVDGDCLRVRCQVSPIREFLVNTRLIKGAPDENGIRREYIVSWTGGRQAPIAPQLEHFPTQPSAAFSEPTHKVTNLQAQGGNRS